MTEVILEQRGKDAGSVSTEDAKQILMDLVHYRTYANTLPDGRKESREEVIDRVKNMHVTKFP